MVVKIVFFFTGFSAFAFAARFVVTRQLSVMGENAEADPTAMAAQITVAVFILEFVWFKK